ncbi:MAG TPA: protein kinase [Thermoanaerobaculia bacterium]|jgi:CHASE2 domain-containing sensor protein
MTSSSAPKLSPGSVLDGTYRLDGLLGEGAVGVVYRATHLGLKKAFALKLLRPGADLDPFSVARFQREAEALGRLRHPHIVTVTDFGVDPGTGAPYLVLELLDGIPLSEICRTAGALPADRALPILEAVAGAVDAAHGQGILHRDLKPGNVLLCGTERDVKVLDFGLSEILPLPPLPPSGRRPAAPGGGGAAETEERLTATHDLLGTPLYVAPELIRRARADRSSDIYSFAAIAYELLVGQPPFQGSTAEVLTGHLEREPSPPAGALPHEIWKTLREALAKDPALRPETARELVRRLRAAAGRERRRRWLRTEAPRRILLSALLAAAVPAAGLLVPGLPLADRWADDLRIRAAPARAPDPRLLLITIDEASLAGPVPLADRADEIGGTLDRVFAAGARGIAVDLLLPDSWSASPGFSSLVLRHPDALTLAAFSTPDGRVLGAGCVGGLTAAALGPRAGALFGFVNLDEDPDGVIRHGRLGFRDRAGGERPSWAARAAGTLSPLPAVSDRKAFWIDHRTAAAGFTRISWRDVPAALAARPWTFRDRLILVGGDLVAAGDDVHRVPHRRAQKATVSGLMLQARLVDTLLAGMPVREPPKAPFLAAAALWSGLAAAATLLVRRPVRILAALFGGVMLYFALSITIFRSTGLLLPVTVLLLPALGALALATILRRALPPIPWSRES